jgi:hypothetical protein
MGDERGVGSVGNTDCDVSEALTKFPGAIVFPSVRACNMFGEEFAKLITAAANGVARYECLSSNAPLPLGPQTDGRRVPW